MPSAPTGHVAVLAPLPAEAVSPHVPDGIEVKTVGVDGNAVDIARGAAFCVADWSSTHRVEAGVVEALAPTCRLVQMPAVGLDGVDVGACRAAGIPVANCAGMNAIGVAEWIVWALLSTFRGFVHADRAMHAGRWEQFGHARFELRGKVVGLVGMGDIARETAIRLRPFGCELRYWTRTRRPAEFEAAHGLAYRPVDDLFQEADALVLAVALTDDTRHLVDAGVLSQLKPTAVVVNAARGEVWDEAAVAEALREGRLHGAATDVYAVEPAPPRHPLHGIDTAVLTPHVAGASVESVVAITGRVWENLRRVYAGEDPLGLV